MHHGFNPCACGNHFTLKSQHPANVSGSEFPHGDPEKVKLKVQGRLRDSSDARTMGHHLRIATDMQ